MNVHSDKKLNVNIYKKSSPVVIDIYQLSSIQKFKRTSLGDLVNEKTNLSSEILSKKEYEVLPNQSFSINEKVLDNAHYLCIIAEFRNTCGRSWREIIDLHENNLKKIFIYLNKNKMSVTIKNKTKWF